MTILEINLAAGGMILLVLALRPLSRRYLTPWALPLLWIPAAFRLAVPWTAPSPLSIANLFSPAVPASGHLAGLSGPLFPSHTLSSPGNAVSSGVPSLGLVVWLAGALLFLGWLAAGFLRWHIRLRKARPCGGYPDRWMKKQGFPIQVVCSPAVTSPVAVGPIHPRIILPPDWKALSQEELEAILAHETAHIRRRDPLWKMASLLLLAVPWFNPLVWMGCRYFCRDLELACDHSALDIIGRNRSAEYALCLIQLAGRRCPAAGLPFTHNPIEERIISMMKIRCHSRIFLLLAAAVTVSAGLALGTAAQSPESPANLPSEAPLAAAWEAEPSLQMPVGENCWISLPYGPVGDFFHSDVDFAPTGGGSHPVLAAGEGKVIFSDYREDFGQQVILDHGDGVQTCYSHLDPGSVLVSQGETVSAGQELARMGQSGNATGIHLAFSMTIDGEAVDPMDYVRQD